MDCISQIRERIKKYRKKPSITIKDFGKKKTKKKKKKWERK